MGISSVDFDYLRQLMRQQTSIVLDAGKEYIAESRLAQLVYKEGFSSVQDLVQQLRSNSFSTLHRRVVNAMMNNETWFFRDLLPFEALRKRVLPDLTSVRGTERTIQIWSAACSVGQEPYSIAMMIRENFPELRTWNIRIMATDVSTSALERAAAGRYSQLEVNRGLPIHLLMRYFSRDGVEWVLSDEIRQMVEFKQMNLAEAWPMLPTMDVVMLRNVLIYFDVPIKKEILGRLRRQLRPDGYMFLGSAETTLNLDENFDRVQYETTAFYRPRI